VGYKRRKRYGNPDANQADIVKFARRRLHLSRDVNTTVVGGGFPDWVIPWRGLTVLIEIKGKDGKLSKGQRDFIDNWTGGPVLVVDSAEDLFRQLIDLDKAKPPVRDLPPAFGRSVRAALAATAEGESTATGGGPEHGAAADGSGGV
jgi:hypothetical protein